MLKFRMLRTETGSPPWTLRTRIFTCQLRLDTSNICSSPSRGWRQLKVLPFAISLAPRVLSTVPLAPSTMKVYMAAIPAMHAKVEGMTVDSHTLIKRFLKGTLRLRPTSPWDLLLVLEALRKATFRTSRGG